MKAVGVLCPNYLDCFSNYGEISWCIKLYTMSKKPKPIEAYSVLSNFGLTEAPLTWTRYAAFLVLEGFILAGVKDYLSKAPDEADYLLVLISLLGIFITMLWHLLNMLGWLNQNEFYYYAAKVKMKEFRLPTNKYRYPQNGLSLSATIKPNSEIYYVAQAVPYLLILVYTTTLGYGLDCYELNGWCFYGCVAGLMAVIVVGVYWLEQCLLKRRVRKLQAEIKNTD